jgi:two-component system, cell cycle sensor histidine kinase and response regulator CckA
VTSLEQPTRTVDLPRPGLLRRRHLATELAFSLVTLVVIVVGILLVLLYNRQSNYWYGELQAKADEYIVNLSETLEVPMWDFDDEQIRRIGEGYARNDLITAIVIRGLDDALLYQFNRDASQSRIIRPSPIVHNDKTIGSVRLALTLDNYRRDLVWLRNVTLMVLAMCLAVITIATRFLLKVLMRKPLSLLYQGMDRVARGEYDYGFDEIHHEEMYSIAKRFSKMADEVRKRERSLQKEVHERKRAEQRSRDSEARARAVLDAMPDIMLQFDRDGQIIDVRGDPANLIETCPHCLGKTIAQIMPTHIARIFRDQIEKALKSHLVRIFEYQLAFKNGDRHFECRMVAVSADLALAIVRNITQQVTAAAEKRRLLDQLQRAQKMEAIGLLAGGVAHDLNNILSGLVSYPELILMDLAPDSPLQEPIRTIRRSGERAASIVQDLLTLARRGVSVSEIVNLNQVIQDYLDSAEYATLRGHYPDFELQLDLAEDLQNISGSPVQLTKTVMNLVSNAAEATESDGVIRIATKNSTVHTPIDGFEQIREGDYVVLTVTDNGTGISDEDIDRIFEPFYTKKVMGRSGTGLGMAVVWGTVKDHLGTIDIQSKPLQGTTVTIHLPATSADLIDAEKPETLVQLKGAGERILVIDDVKDQREIAIEMLTRLGYQVESVSSGEAAVDHMREKKVDLLVLDMIMDPGIDGLETYRRIIRTHPGQRAVITSGFSESERVHEARRLGAGAYVKKPYSVETIAKAVKAALNGN